MSDESAWPAVPGAVAPAVPPPVRTTKDARTWAMFCHLSALAGYVIPIPLANIVAPLILWRIRREEYPLVEEHGKEALNFQISVTIWAIVLFPFCFVCVGIPLLIALMLTNLVCIIIAAVGANDGKSYRYPLTIRFIK